MELDQSAIESIIRWAESHTSILEVWLFGSRASGAPKPFSDIDLAILLKPGGDAMGLFVAKHREWQKELSAIVPFKVDLRATQEDHPSYPNLLSGEYKGARRLWARPDA
jgi:predicted nucleotidyltransferase